MRGCVARARRRAAVCLTALAAALVWIAHPSAQNVAWPSEPPPRPLPAREVKFPPYEVRMLPNGLQIVTVLHHEQPAVTMRLLVRAGAAQDPAKKHGLAFLTAQLLDQGTRSKSASQIADEVDYIGGAMGTGSGADHTSAYVVVMKDSFMVGMNMLADVVRNPAFAPEEIERQKEQAISSLKVSSDDPDYVASTVFDRLVFGLHPYGIPGNGTPESLASITRDDLQTFHRQYFVPNNMVLAIVGDVTGDEAFGAAQQVFGGWARGQVPAATAPEPPAAEPRLVIVDKPDAVQTEIRVGQIAIPRKHPDYTAWDLAVRILGGEGANRLHNVLRSERGLTYGASADNESMKQAGDFVAETDTRTETTGEALRLMVDEFARLQRERVSERELAAAQAYVSGSFPLTIETPNDIATQVLNAVFFDLPLDEISTFRERLQAVSSDDIQRVSRQYIKPDRLSIVLVGNAQGFLPQLRAVGFANYEVIPLQQLDIMSATLRRAPPRTAAMVTLPDTLANARRTAYVPEAPASRTGLGLDARGRRVAQAPAPAAPPVPPAPQTPGTAASRGAAGDATDLLRRVVDAKGGLAALKGVRTVVADADTVVLMQQGGLSSPTKTSVIYPDKFRVDASVNGAAIVQIYNAGNAWVKDPGGVHEAPPPMKDDFAASVRRDTIPLLIAAADGRYTVRQLPAETRDGATLRVLEISGPGLQPVRLFVDDTMLIARQAFSTPGPDGRPVATEEVFSDYRVVNGVRIPFSATLLRGGRPVVRRTLTNVTINGPLSDRQFDRPS